MSLYLIRHARAARRSVFGGGDGDRPLTEDGRAQARALVESLDGDPIDRILSSPALRCRETVTPLSARRGLQLEIEPRLFEGSGLGGVERLIDELGEANAVLCSHGDLIPALIHRLRLDPNQVRCGRASIWRIDRGPAATTLSYEPPPCVEDEGRVRVGVLDLGTTSFHLLVADVGSDGELVRVTRKREMLRLGAMIPDEGALPDEVAERVYDTACRLRDAAWNAGAETLHCVATAAFRDGAHGRSLASELSRRLGTQVQVLSGAQEAHAIFAALRRRIGLGTRPVLGLDLGGGSLEIALGDAGAVHWETTLAVGAVRMHGAYGGDGADCDLGRVRAHVRRMLAPVRDRIRSERAERCLATGGTARAVGRLMLGKRRAPERDLCGLVVSHAQIAELCEALAKSTHDERLEMPGMSERRVDLLPAGAVVLKTVLEELEQPQVTVCDWGLREGVLLTALRDARRRGREVYSVPAR